MSESRLSFKEMCAKFEVTPRTLRYYEYIELLKPEKEGRNRFYGPREVALIGAVGGELHRTALAAPAPGAVVALSGPLCDGRPRIDDADTAYVCRQFVCDAPTTDPQILASQLR